MRGLRSALVVGVGVLAAGCMQFEYGVTLDEDLSGTADLDLQMDFDRIARAMAAVQHTMSGQEGEATEEEIAAAREELLADIDEDEDLNEDSLSAEIRSDLPEGMKLVYARSNRDGLVQKIGIRLAFDHVDRLKELSVGEDEESEGKEPFEGLEIVTDGDEIVVRNEPINPLEEVDESPMVTDEMLERWLSGFAVRFRLTTPFRPVEHNATRVEGNSLVWEFNYQTLRSGEPAGIYARLKR